MLLSSIQIQGFKSFADKTTLKFGRGITAVVGPNGSGKSNISDAVRWVLGEQSTKSLRGQSMEDVIFSGTALRRPHGYCEVTLNIDNSDRSLNFDNDFVSVTRRYYRSHESEYLINNVTVRLKDVHELFMDTGLGRDGYSMIGQGKIDSIISSKSSERRDIFEEASGISKYRYRKTEAERKLSAAQENLLRLKDIMAELESRVGPLSEQSKKAEKFLALAEDKKQLEIGLWLYTLNNSKEALRAQESKIALAELQYKEIETALAQFDKQVAENSENITLITNQIEEKRIEISSKNEECVKAQGTVSVLESNIEHLRENITRVSGEIEALGVTDSAIREEIDAKNADIEAKKAEAVKIGTEIGLLNEELSQLLISSESISKQIEEQVRALNNLSALGANHRVTVMTCNSSIEQINERSDSLDELIAQRQAEITEIGKETADNDKLLTELEETITSCQNALKGYELRYATRVDAVNKAKEEADNLRLDIDAKNRRIQILEDLEKNLDGFSHAVKAVVSESSKGILRGVHGPVSKVIKVKKEYSTAVETALGNSIQHIIVDSEADAKRAIELLKSDSKGRATFMPISSIKAKEFTEKGFEDMFGFVGVADSLVECDDKYREIIKYLLGGTVVAEDIDTAIAIAKKFKYHFKVVSLDGQVVNAGGSLTGGSLIKNAGLLSRNSDIERIKNDIKKLEEKAEIKAQTLREATEQLARADADIVAAKAELTTANEDKIRVLGELKRLNEITQTLKNAVDELVAEKTESGKKVEELKALADSASAEIVRLDGEKSALQSKIDEMTGGREDLSTEREEIASKITDAKMAQQMCEKDMENLGVIIASLENSVTDRAEKIKNLETELENYNSEIQRLTLEISEINGGFEDYKNLTASLEKEIEELTLRRVEIEKSGTTLRETEKERIEQKEKLSGEVARLQERKDIMVREYDDVIRQLYDEYQLTRTDAEALGIEIEDPKEAKKNLNEIRSKIRALGSVNVAAIEEFKEVSERYNFMSAQIADVETSKDELNKLINRLTSQMQELFVTGFNRINECFSKTFKELFGGGEASLVLSNPENVLESGIEIKASLPGKNVPSLDGLSGGEKSLVALAIYFAIMRVSAPPFCFLDEVDTALDDINVERFAEYMKQSDFATQFICVTHRRGTMEAADMLYGVTMQEKGITKLLELNTTELVKKLNLEKE